MSTFTAVGPALDIDGPLPVAPPHSLLETRVWDLDAQNEPVLASVVRSRDATRVLNGVNVWGYPEGCASLWEPCSDGTFRTKSEDSDWPLPRFDSFVVYKPVTCSTISVGADPEEFSRRAERALDAVLSAGIESALAQGVTQSSNPFFGDASVSILNSGTAVSPGVALSHLEDAIAATCRVGMIHATPGVVSGLQAFPLPGDDLTRLITANGTPVVSGMGYVGVDTPWLTTPGATEDWVFATGPVHVYLGPLVIYDVKESLDRSDNVLTFRAERYVVALWDTSLQAAILVDWAT